jgi:hypothetical protein
MKHSPGFLGIIILACESACQPSATATEKKIFVKENAAILTWLMTSTTVL